MRSFIAIFSLVLIGASIQCFGQGNFVPGGITLINGDNQEGLVNDLLWSTSPTNVEFKNSAGDTKRYLPEDLLEFRIGNKAVYRSRLIKFDSTGFSEESLTNDKNPTFKTKHVFLKVLVESEKSLLVYNPGASHFFVQSGNSIDELVNHQFEKVIGGTPLKFENKLYISMLAGLFSDCSMQIPSKLQYTARSLINIFSEYASCKREPSKVFNSSEPSIIRFGGVGTLAYDNMTEGFTGGRGFAAGGFLVAYLPPKVYRFSIYGELVYRMFGDQLWEGKDFAGLPYKETHQVRSIKFTALGRYGLGKRLAPAFDKKGYLGFGFSFSVGLNDLYQRGPFVGKSAAPFAGGVLNTGFYISKNVALDLRYELGGAITYSDYTSQDNRPPKSDGYYSLQASILLEF